VTAATAPIDERKFHRWLARTLPSGATGRLPLGDDAASVDLPRGTVPVVSTDALVEGTHFLPGSPPRLVGRAASAVSLSDVAAKGAAPLAVFLAVLVPPGSPSGWPRAVSLGAEAEAAEFGAHLLGGDTKPAPVRSVVSTVVGAARPSVLVRRSGARPGDAVVTTGVVGRGGVAAEQLRRRGPEDPRAAAGIVRIQPRVKEGLALARFAGAMLDTSDGLAESARLMAAASRVHLVIDESALPYAPGIARLPPASRRAQAFYGGDYELLAAVPMRSLEPATRAVLRSGGRLSRIGSVRRGWGASLSTGAGTLEMPPGGWQPFRRVPP